MNSTQRWSAVNLVYAAICAIVGGALVAVGQAADIGFVGAVGGIALLVGLLYLLAGLFTLARSLAEPDE